MTTAHRPTWHNALGGDGQGGNRLASSTIKVSARDQPGELRVKHRHLDSKSREEFAEDLRNREQLSRKKTITSLGALPEYENPFPEDADDIPNGGMSISRDSNVKNVNQSGEQKAVEESCDSDSDDDDDDEAELLREIEKIKKERQAEEDAKLKEEEKRRLAEQKNKIVRANPLLIESGEGGLKRRWDDEVVFKNQAKDLPKAKKQFINDPVRSEFHKKFLLKYVD